MMVIFKYSLKITNYQPLSLPTGAEILSIQDQDGSLCLWALIDENAMLETRAFAVHGTGHFIFSPIEKHLATVQQGGLVWHVFEVKAL